MTATDNRRSKHPYLRDIKKAEQQATAELKNRNLQTKEDSSELEV